MGKKRAGHTPGEENIGGTVEEGAADQHGYGASLSHGSPYAGELWDTDCHDQFANWSRNDRGFCKGYEG